MPFGPKIKSLAAKGLILIPWALLIAFSLIYFSFGGKPALIYSIFLPLLLWIYGSHEAFLDSPSLPWALGCCAVLFSFIFLHPVRSSIPELAGLILQWLLMACCLALSSLFFSRVQSQILEIRDEIEQLSVSLKSKLKENEFYQNRIASLKSQIGERRRLASYAREMGTLLDPNLIRQTLIEKTKKLFPSEAVSLRSVSVEDPIDAWVGERKISVLIKDTDHDQRLGTAGPAGKISKSVIATPLLVSRKLMGLLRVDSEAAGRFSEPDLQELEVYASLAILALENAQLFSEVNAMATKDGLTGLATHRIFQDKLAEELLRAARYRTPVSLIMADIDHFKSVNDTYGHLAGDEVLREMGKILLGRLRPVDFAARYGGEEFCLILPGYSLKETKDLAEAIRGDLESHAMFPGGRAFSVTASFGCAVFPQDAQVASQLLRKADERLYRAKSSGRNRVLCE